MVLVTKEVGGTEIGEEEVIWSELPLEVLLPPKTLVVEAPLAVGGGLGVSEGGITRDDEMRKELSGRALDITDSYSKFYVSMFP